MPIGSLISGGLNLIGGLFGKSSADANRASQEAMADRNIQLQKEFAQQGVRWKVADARAAGINPLAALGASTSSFAPVAIGNTSDSSMQTALSNMGQDVGRAVNATRTAPERAEAMALTTLQLDGLKLDNDIKRATLASVLQKLKANANPPFPLGEGPPDKRPPLMFGGSRFPTDEWTSNVEDIQKRYGEPGEWAAAPVVLFNDLMSQAGVPAGARTPWSYAKAVHDLIRQGLRRR